MRASRLTSLPGMIREEVRVGIERNAQPAPPPSTPSLYPATAGGGAGAPVATPAPTSGIVPDGSLWTIDSNSDLTLACVLQGSTGLFDIDLLTLDVTLARSFTWPDKYFAVTTDGDITPKAS
jgi:hypothetical protein